MLIDTLLFEDGPGELRTAALADGRVFEVGHHRALTPSQVGAVFLGRIRRIIPSLNAAFIDLGTGRDGFLRANGVRWPADQPRRLSRVLHEGEALVVQVTRDAAADKSPVVTSLAKLPGRFMDYSWQVPGLCCAPGVTVEQGQVGGLLEKGEGVYLRASPDSGDALRADLESLRAVGRAIRAAAAQGDPPRQLALPPSRVAQTLATHKDAPLRHIQTNTQGLARAVRDWCERYRPELAECVESSSSSVFDAYEVETEIETALSTRLALPNGTELIFDEGEVLTAIDVNSGASDATPGRAAMETNVAALPEIARQLRLRRIGGAVVIDLLKVRDGRDRKYLVETFRELVKADSVQCHVLGLSALGLLEMTRQRMGPSLAEELLAPSREPSPRAETIAYRVLRCLRREAVARPGLRLVIDAAPDVADLLRTDLYDAVCGAAGGMADISAVPGRPIERFEVRSAT